MKKRILPLLLTAAMVAGLAGCGSSAAKETTAASDNNQTTAESTEAGSTTGEKILKVQVGPDPETVDPALNSAVDGGNMILHAFEGLLTLDENGQLKEGQAESWETSEDGLTWTFHLRDGLKWSDGTDLTAKDFVYSWQRVCDPNVAAPYAETVLGMVKGYDEAVAGDITKLDVQAPDEKTVVVNLAHPCSYFGELAAFATLNPVQQATVEANGDAWATSADTYISNGPFMMTEWVPGSHITFSKNPNYWNAEAIKLDKLEFELIEDSNAAYSAYTSGEVDMIKDVPTEEIPSLQGNDDFHVEPIIGTYYVSLNLQKEYFQDARVRKALSLAIDRNYVANTLMQGTYSPASSIVGPGWLDTDGSSFAENANGGTPYIDNDNFDANLEEAKKLLEEAGYPNGEGFPQIEYTTNDAGYHKVVAEYLQQAWAAIGIDLKVNIVEWASFTPMRRNGEFDVARNGWVGDYTDPSNILELFCTTNGNNDGKYTNADFDAAIEDSRVTTDAATRSADLHKAEDALMNDAGCIPIAYYNDFWLQSSKITGSWHSANGFWYFMYADITE
ncbi:peptide ABC transporter substrate-binding protein [Coprococcus catus]|uniref:peptide ABC transporter substrate-binding protein n=1 Tax=Coprococcus catus TaxID=116085 RepID=UPI001C022379|nr:peptide ABC transporter substrate-binding protein [Coprococcus catus]MBT9770533.1 peptide ABC transporter substrate-binding protein [Coprococcus catus]MCO7146118.1 peptide ABC transporter substrate-binding protein [Coprococcus catus]MEE0140576.1 peptide ABC transporter substrate-binding protein [Coprococcus sp.]